MKILFPILKKHESIRASFLFQNNREVEISSSNQEVRNEVPSLKNLKEKFENTNLKNISEEKANILVSGANEEIQKESFQEAKDARSKVYFAMGVELIDLPETHETGVSPSKINILPNYYKDVSVGVKYLVPKKRITVTGAAKHFESESKPRVDLSVSHDPTGLSAFYSQEYENTGVNKSFYFFKDKVRGTVGVASNNATLPKPYLTGSLEFPLGRDISAGGYVAVKQDYWQASIQKQLSEKSSILITRVKGGMIKVGLNVYF